MLKIQANLDTLRTENASLKATIRELKKQRTKLNNEIKEANKRKAEWIKDHAKLSDFELIRVLRNTCEEYKEALLKKVPKEKRKGIRFVKHLWIADYDQKHADLAKKRL